jgi:hypothetical protein
LEISLAERGEAIGLFATRVVFFLEAFNPTFFEQAAESAVESAGAEANAAVAHFGGVLEDGVAVARLIGEAEKDEENGLGDWCGLNKYWRDMSHGDMLEECGSGVKGKMKATLGFVREKDGVAGATLVSAGADALELDAESGVAKALFEIFILLRGPDSEHTIVFESGVGRGYATVVIEGRVVRGGEGGGAVVHVEQHGIELCEARIQYDGDVAGLDVDARIVQWVSRQRSEWATIPLHDPGQQFGNENVCLRREEIERGAKREAHAEAADQDDWLFE